MSFPTTQWSLIATAAMNDGRDGREALNELCRRYRVPVLSFFRAKTGSLEDAEDLTQSLFEQMHRKGIWHRADAAKGRFRNFVLTLAINAYRNWKMACGSAKRGGGKSAMSLDLLNESGWEPASPDTGAALSFDIEWATAVTDGAWRVVEKNAGATPLNAARFTVLRRFLPGTEAPPSYEEAAATLGVPVDHVKPLIGRLRTAFRKALQAQIADTLLASEDLEEEMQYLHSVMKAARGGPVVPS